MDIWAEVARTMVYVQNHAPHGVLKNNTPKEVFSGKKLEVSHLRINDTNMNEEIQEEDRELEEPQEPMDPPQEKP